MADVNEKKSLIARIAEACNEVKGVEKKGKNEIQNYKYVKAADVAKEIRHKFFERNIVLVIDEKEFTPIGEIKTKSGNLMSLMLLRCEVTFYDGESADKLGPFGAFGTAADSGDKSIYKCKTGALKYVLRSIGLIPDEKDDPEADENVDAETAPDKRIEKFEDAFDQRTEGDQYLAIFQMREIHRLQQVNGITDGQLLAFLKAKFGVERVEKVKKSDFEPLRVYVAGQMPIQEALETSLNGSGRTTVSPLAGEDSTVSIEGLLSSVAQRKKADKVWLSIKMQDGLELSDWHLDHESTLKGYVGKRIEFLAKAKGAGDKTYYNVDSLEIRV